MAESRPAMRWVRRLSAVAAVVACGGAVAVWLARGMQLTVGGVELNVRSTRPVLLMAAACGLLWVGLTGVARTRELVGRVGRQRWAAMVAAALALATMLMAVRHNGWTASGADQYVYVSQMDLLLAGRLAAPMPLAASAPWPRAIEAFAPFGYRPSLDGTAIVPVTAPGFPLLMAGAKLVAGHCAAFLVPPAAAAGLVGLTFLLGRRLVNSAVGLGAAWLVATSPVVLAMAKATMSDVPAAALWALASWAALGTGLASACAGGLAAAGAILVRPHLAPVAAVMALWMFSRKSEGASQSSTRALVFAAATLPGAVAVGWVNTILYGSPLSSGYGDADALFSMSHVGTNLLRYAGWLTETQTPFVWLGVLALLVVPSWVWPGARGRAGAGLLAAVAAVVVSVHLLYLPFEAWWFLRFLLAAWPALSVGTVAAVMGLGLRLGRAGHGVAAALVVAVGAHNALTAVRLGEYPPGEGERRYASLALHVARLTEPDAVIIAGQHAGPLRYYAGRLTLRFDQIDTVWLDRTVAWLRDQGRTPYFVLEDWEVPRFAGRFGLPDDGALGLVPVLAYKADRVGGVALLFEPTRTAGTTEQPVPVRDPKPRCVLPAQAP